MTAKTLTVDPASNTRVALPYQTPLELWNAFKAGTQFVLHYHGKVFQVSHMERRERVVYVQPPGMPLKVFPDGSSAEGLVSQATPTIWLEQI